MILLNEIKLNNFLSHESTTITFQENEKLLLDGKSGSGKSSITEAVLWCLFGRGRTDNRSLVRRGAKLASVSLRLTEGESSFNITRTVSANGKNTCVVTRSKSGGSRYLPIESTGLKDTQEWIEKTFLRSSYELFTNSIAYPQENENSFVKASASKRKDILLEIVKAENFDELYIQTRDAITRNESSIAVIDSQVAGYEKSIKYNEELAGQLDKFEKEVNEIDKELVIKMKEQKKLEDKRQEEFYLGHQYEDVKALSDHLKEGVVNLGNQILKNVERIEEFDKYDDKLMAEKKNELDVLIQKENEISKEIEKNVDLQYILNNHLANRPGVVDYSREIEQLNKQLIPLIKDSGKCPAGDDCPFTAPIRGQIAFLEEQIQKKEQATLEEGTSMALWEEKYSQLKQPTDSTELFQQVGEIKEKEKLFAPFKETMMKHEMDKDNIELLKKKIEEDRSQLIKDTLKSEDVNKQAEELHEKLGKFNSKEIESQIYNGETVISLITKNREEAVRNSTLAQKAKETIEEARIALKTLVKDTKITKGWIDDLLLLKEALSPRGVKTVAIDYLIPQLEERINTVLCQMSDFKIRLDTQKATADEEGIKEGLFITVINDQQEELSFDSYSGGEKVKITIAISEALATLMNQIGFRIMDENIVSLDKESTEGFVEVLTKLQESFPQLIVISHLEEVKDIFEKRLTIIKTNGVSRIALDN